MSSSFFLYPSDKEPQNKKPEDLFLIPQKKKKRDLRMKAPRLRIYYVKSMSRKAWVLDCNSLQRLQCCGSALSVLWEGQLSPEGLPGKAFISVYDHALKITHRFLTKSWTPHYFMQRGTENTLASSQNGSIGTCSTHILSQPNQTYN